MDKETIEALFQFFGNFNQDWDLDNPDWLSVVWRFVQNNTPERVAFVHQGIASLLSSDFSESELEEKVIDEFGAYYLPSADGMSFRQWLTEVNQLIEDHSSGGSGWLPDP